MALATGTMLAIGAALGAAKNIGDQQAASSNRKAQAEIQRWSPWTGMQGQMVQDPSLMGNIATGTAIGSQLGKMAPGSALGTPEAAGLPKAAEYASSTPNPNSFSIMGQNPPSWLAMAQQQGMPSLYGR